MTGVGWELPERYSDTYRLVFGDPEFKGLEIVVRRMALGAFRATASVATVDREQVLAGKVDDFNLATIDRILAELGEALVRWNITRKGEPVPCNIQELNRLDLAFGYAVLDAWMDAAARHQLPQQPQPEPDDDDLDESDLPMTIG